MSLEDMERAGVTLPRDQWGKRDLRSAVNRKQFVAAAATAAVASFLMFAGNGGAITWLGSLLFLIALFAATGMALRATDTHGRTPADDRT